MVAESGELSAWYLGLCVCPQTNRGILKGKVWVSETHGQASCQNAGADGRTVFILCLLTCPFPSGHCTLSLEEWVPPVAACVAMQEPTHHLHLLPSLLGCADPLSHLPLLSLPWVLSLVQVPTTLFQVQRWVDLLGVLVCLAEVGSFFFLFVILNGKTKKWLMLAMKLIPLLLIC